MANPTNIIVECPNCNQPVQIVKIACGIFRHGTFKNKKLQGKQINPHATKSQCESYLKKDLIFGCAKPFRVIKSESGEYIGEPCDYI